MGDGGVEPSPVEPLTFAEYADEMCAYYMAIGVPYQEFWHGDYSQLRYYFEADKHRRERENYLAWLQGAYVYDAICAVSPILHAFAKKGTKPLPYLKKPYDTEKKNPVTKEEFLAQWKAKKAAWKAARSKQSS